MPERWQDELKKLRREEMPESVRERAERGPQRELPNDGRQRLVAGAVAFAVFIAAGTFAWRAFDGRDDARSAVEPASAVVVDLAADPFAATLTYEGVTQDGIENGSSWDTPNGSNMGMGPYAIEFDSYVRIPTGTPITIQGDATEVSVALEDPGNAPGPARIVALDAGTGVLPGSPGRYEMHVTGHWDRGFAIFAFGVQIVDRDSEGVVLSLTSTDRGPEASLSSGGVGQDGLRTEYDWCDGSGECVQGFADPADPDHPVSQYLVVPTGAEINVDGDGSVTHYTVRSNDASPSDPTLVTDVTEPPLLVPEEPGRYVVRVEAAWDAGSGLFAFGVEVLPAIDDVPDILHLTCTLERATLDATVVQVQADGLHISVDAGADVAGADLITRTTPEEFFGIGLDKREDGTRGYSIAPGEWGAGCYEGARGAVGPSDFGTPRVASFTIIDPDDRYAEPDLTCADPTALERVIDLRAADAVPSADTIRGLLTGLEDGDVVREGGYDDAAAFKLGLTYVVQRNGETIARITLGALPGSPLTGAIVDACSGAGIDTAKIDETEVPDTSVPDLAVLRCTADGTELDTPVVQVQPDGLHIDATNLAHATLIELVPQGSHSLIGTDAFDGTDHREVVLQVPPGRATIACRTPEGGSITGGPAEHPDLFVPIEIVDPTGIGGA